MVSIKDFYEWDEQSQKDWQENRQFEFLEDEDILDHNRLYQEYNDPCYWINMSIAKGIRNPDFDHMTYKEMKNWVVNDYFHADYYEENRMVAEATLQEIIRKWIEKYE